MCETTRYNNAYVSILVGLVYLLDGEDKYVPPCIRIHSDKIAYVV